MPEQKLKVCGVCKQSKPTSDFNKNKLKKDGLRTHCKECSKERSKAYYARNREHHKDVCIARRKKHCTALLQYTYDYLKKVGCQDCGENDPCCLDFDHQRDKKQIISKMVAHGVGLSTLLEEIEKCVVRCANCHRKKTAKDQSWYKNIET